MRIAHIGSAAMTIGYPSAGDAERRIVDLALAQQLRGDTVLVFSAVAPTPGPRPPGAAHSLRIIDLECRGRGPLADAELALRTRAAMRRIEPDVIHAHNNIAAARCLAGIGGIKVLSFDQAYLRGSHGPVAATVHRRALSAFDLVVSESDACMRAAAEPFDYLGLLYGLTRRRRTHRMAAPAASTTTAAAAAPQRILGSVPDCGVVAGS
jgi:hypothetical protein